MVFLNKGWVKRRSTRTTNVLLCLSPTTTPCRVRFGILYPLHSRSTLGAGALLLRDRLEAGDVAPHLAHARGILQLSGGALKTQIELLLLQLEHLVVDLIERHRSGVGCFHDTATR